MGTMNPGVGTLDPTPARPREREENFKTPPTGPLPVTLTEPETRLLAPPVEISAAP